ncbi:tyrosine-type recombinase/integrase [Microbacteriaceae bacterium K1510]|nr:tyrosine-type recombinase/integrase [Microbacteriaceae bacterium K1510]
MNVRTTMLARAEAYLVERRALGFALDRAGSLTLSFARFADVIGHDGSLNSEVVLRWAKHEATLADPFTWAKRVDVLRPFARWLAEAEPETIFPQGKPFGRSYRRLAPHIYTMAEIIALLTAARTMPSRFGAGAETMPTLLGLLAATGLRISEALRLRCADWDAGASHLTVHHSKFDRSRIVPVHPSTTAELQRYLNRRAHLSPVSAVSPFFVEEREGNALHYGLVRQAWLHLRTCTGIVPRGGYSYIRIHDLRHTFICRRLMLWQAQGVDIDNAMLALSTYVGHAQPGDTYWYLQAVPELMAVAGTIFERFGNERGETCHV